MMPNITKQRGFYYLKYLSSNVNALGELLWSDGMTDGTIVFLTCKIW